MALNENIYNPKNIAINNPLGSQDLYPFKQLTPESVGRLDTQSIMLDHLDENNLGYSDIRTIEGKYSFDVSQVVTTYRRGIFPMLFAADMNSKPTSTGGDIHVQAEDHDQDIQFADTLLNKLRIASYGSAGKPLAIDDAANMGGRLIYRAVTAADVTRLLSAKDGVTDVTNLASSPAPNNIVVSPTAVREYTIAPHAGIGGHQLLTIGWRLGASNEESLSAGGSNAQVYCTKMAGLLESNWYRKLGQDDGVNNDHVISEGVGGLRWYGYVHERPLGAVTKNVCTVHAMFDDMMIQVDGVDYQLHEIAVRVYGFFFSADFKSFVLMLDFNYNNFDSNVILGTTNKVLMEEVFDKAGNPALTTFKTGFTRLSTHMLLGNFLTVPDPIEQGSNVDPEQHSGRQYARQMKHNYAQIVRSPTIDITGTYLASQGRMRLNQAQKMRDDMMMKYKTSRRNLMLWGKGASQSVSSNGKVINTSAGLFCYQHNPIRYMRHKLRFDASNRYESIKRFVMDYARAIFAFKPELQSNGVVNVYISKYMHMMLDEYLKLGAQEMGNISGTYAGMQQNMNQSNYDFRIKLNDISTPYGTLRFVVDPGLDYQTENLLPSFMGNVQPKNMLLAIDKSKMSTVVLRAPRLRGNIQSPDSDYSREDIISEETFELLDPTSHCVMALDVV